MSNKVLRVTHNAAFFSCCSIRLYDIINYFNSNKELPEIVDSSEQFQMHKNQPGDITHYFFKTTEDNIPYSNEVIFTTSNDERQFLDYSTINLKEVLPFVKKYFKLSDFTRQRIDFFIEKYRINYQDVCAVYYRGLDKVTETNVGSHETFIDKCKEIHSKNPNIKFLVQTDELDFVEKFISEFGDCILINELPKIRKQTTLVTYHIQPEHRVNFGIDFLAATYIVSQCKILVTHSGNCGLWSVLLRGNFENVHQYITAGLHSEKQYGFWTEQTN
jgi:hypothetical protein